MKHVTTLGFAVTLSFILFADASYSGTVQLPYQTKAQLKAKCDAAGGDYTSSGGSHSCWGKKGSVLCNKGSNKCVGDCAACGTKAVTKSLPEIVSGTKGKKRPKVLQQGDGGGNSGPVNPIVLGRETPGGSPVGGGSLED